MGEMIVIRYGGEYVSVTREVAEFLAKNCREIANSDRRYRRHNVPLEYQDPDNTLDTKHCTGRNYLLNVVIRNTQDECIRDIVKSLGEESYELFCMRYKDDLTQQQIADKLGLSKMAICKRLQKLQNKVAEIIEATYPEWFKELSGFFFMWKFTNLLSRDRLVER